MVRIADFLIEGKDVYAEIDPIFKLDRYNGHVNVGPFEIYVRSTQRGIDGEIKKTFDIGSINAVKTERTGQFKEVLTHVEKMSKLYGYDGVYVESIVNDWLPGKLEDYGYMLVNAHEGIHMYKDMT